ncbi:MAG: LysR family transcriptional regulator [Woeseiaceae bacterium]
MLFLSISKSSKFAFERITGWLGTCSAIRKFTERTLHHLFERTARGLLPTEEAKVLAGEVERIYGEIRSLRRITRNLRNNPAGHIRIVAITGLGFDLLPRAIAEFQKNHSEVTFELQTEHFDQLATSLFERENDIGLAFQPPSRQGLDTIELGQAEFACVYSPGMLTSHGERVSLDELASLPFISMSDRGPLGRIVANELGQRSDMLEPYIVAETGFIAKSLVAYCGGVTIVDEFTAAADGFQDIAYKKFDPPVTFSVNAIYVESRPLNNICAAFLDCFKAVFQSSGSSV